MSLTQTGNYIAIAGVISAILAQLGVVIPEDQIAVIIAGIVALIGVITSFYGRYRMGDIKLSGSRKQ